MELKDQDVIMDKSEGYAAFTRLGSTKAKMTTFIRQSSYDPQYKAQFDQIHRVESKIRREVIQQIKEKEKPLK